MDRPTIPWRVGRDVDDPLIAGSPAQDRGVPPSTEISVDVPSAAWTIRIRPGSATAMRDPSRDHSTSFCSNPDWGMTETTVVCAEATSVTHSSDPTTKATCPPLGDHSGQIIDPPPGTVTRSFGGDTSPRSFRPTTTTARSVTGHTPRKVVTGSEARASPYARSRPSGENRGHSWAMPSPTNR